MDPVIIQQLAQLSTGNDEVTLIENRLELLTQKKIICKFENFVYGSVEFFQIDIDADESGRRASNWTFTLSPSSGLSYLSVFKYKKTVVHTDPYYSNTERNVWHFVEASILDTNGVRKGNVKKSDLCNYTNGAEMEIFQINKNLLDLPMVSPGVGCLIIEATLKILRKTPNVKTKLEKKVNDAVMGPAPAATMESKPKTDFRAFLNSEDHSDVKIISGDGQEFHAHKVILRVGSEYFDKMFKSGMSESKTGIVKLDDMSAPAVTFLLVHIYCGDILPLSLNGKRFEGNIPVDVIDVEVKDALYVASKYQLKDVLLFIDRSFRRFCSEENAMELFELSKLHSLDCKDVLKQFIKSHPNVLDAILDPY